MKCVAGRIGQGRVEVSVCGIDVGDSRRREGIVWDICGEGGLCDRFGRVRGGKGSGIGVAFLGNVGKGGEDMVMNKLSIGHMAIQFCIETADG